MLISFCFILSLFDLNSLSHTAFLFCFFSLTHMLFQNCLLSSAFGFSLFIFLIPYPSVDKLFPDFVLDKHSVDLILVHSLLIYLKLYWFCMESLLQVFYHCSYSVFLYAILLFKFLIFFFPSYLSFLVTF